MLYAEIKSSNLLNNFKNFNIFRNKCVFKSKKQDFSFSLKSTVLEKSQGGGWGFKLTPILFRIENGRKLLDFRYFDANLC